MAVKRNAKIKEPIAEPRGEMKAEKGDKGCCYGSRWVMAGWAFLLIGGLSHMMPAQMAPILHWALWGVTLQTVIGALSVILALYFLLEE